jgi:tetratricopeptide (TPR) repeat protein
MRRKSLIVIRSEDHVGDPLGVLFLVGPEELGDRVDEKLASYLGARIRILKAVITSSRIEVEVDSLGLSEESDRMLEAAARLCANGLNRPAQSILRDALKLDPLNVRAMAMLGDALLATGEPAEALRMLVRAREVAGDSADLLARMADCCLKIERRIAAIAYLERALEIDPRHFSARRAIRALGRKPPAMRVRRDSKTLKLNLK